jgi:hypothetical protein
MARKPQPRPDPEAREALGEAFARDLWASWKKHGPAALEQVRTDKPDLYVKLVTAMLPKETAKAADLDELDDAALDRRISALAHALGLAIRAGAEPGGEAAAAGAEPPGGL